MYLEKIDINEINERIPVETRSPKTLSTGIFAKIIMSYNRLNRNEGVNNKYGVLFVGYGLAEYLMDDSMYSISPPIVDKDEATYPVGYLMGKTVYRTNLLGQYEYCIGRSEKDIQVYARMDKINKILNR